MKIAFTGPRYLTDAQKEQVREVVFALPDGTQFITGGCIGLDTFVAETAFRYRLERNWHVHTIMPAGWMLKPENSDRDYMEHCDSFEVRPTNDNPYRDRDEEMVRQCNKLVGFPRLPEKQLPRSGTWMTIRIARKSGMPVSLHPFYSQEGEEA